MAKPTYIYLQLRLTWRNWVNWLVGIYEVKIGISKRPDLRIKQNTKNMSGWFFSLYKKQLPDALELEQSLHKVYADKNFKIKGNGGTEMFRLTSRDLRAIKRRIKERAEKTEKQVSEMQLLVFVVLWLAFIYILTMGQ